jgi:hypothetical protein
MPTVPRRPAAQRERDRLEARRLRAAELFATGVRQAEVARQLEVSAQAVSVWHRRWQAGGTEGLERVRVARARSPAMTPGKATAWNGRPPHPHLTTTSTTCPRSTPSDPCSTCATAWTTPETGSHADPQTAPERG